MTTIVNIKYNKCDVYCGRPSIYSNPYKIGEHGTRQDVIELYKIHFYDKIRRDEKFRTSILKLKDKVLGCWCVPLECHLEIIKEYLDTLP